MPEKSHSLTNINEADFVNQYGPDADRIEGNPEAMLALVDLIFGFEPDRFPPS